VERLLICRRLDGVMARGSACVHMFITTHTRTVTPEIPFDASRCPSRTYSARSSTGITFSTTPPSACTCPSMMTGGKMPGMAVAARNSERTRTRPAALVSSSSPSDHSRPMPRSKSVVAKTICRSSAKARRSSSRNCPLMLAANVRS